MEFVPIVIIVIFAIYIINSIKILREYERAVIFRLGRLYGAKGPGVILVFAPLDRMVRVDLRQQALEVPPQDIITRDNVTLKVNAVIYWEVIDASQAVIRVQNYYWQTQQFSQTTLRSVLGEVDLDELLAHRDKLNARIQTILDQHTSPYGVKVANVEIKQVDLPDTMQRAMAKQAEAEREKRAKIIHAEGEFAASQRLTEAADEVADVRHVRQDVVGGHQVGAQAPLRQVLTGRDVEEPDLRGHAAGDGRPRRIGRGLDP